MDTCVLYQRVERLANEQPTTGSVRGQKDPCNEEISATDSTTEYYVAARKIQHLKSILEVKR